jgi:hypothetical protein
MPTYSFVDVETREPVDVFLPFAQCPDYGDIIEHEGRQVEHIFAPECPEMSIKRDTRFVAWSLPPVVDHDGAPMGHWNPESIDFDRRKGSASYGQPLISSKSDIDKIEKESKGEIRYGV